MKKLLLLLALIPTLIKAQVVGSLRDSTLTVAGVSWNIIYYAPPDYHTNPDSCALAMFFPGFGEQGTDRNKLYVRGPLPVIKNYLDGVSTTNKWDATTNVNGVYTRFVVVGVQKAGTSSYANESEVLQVYNHLLNKFQKAARNRVHFQGLSAGTCAAWRFVMGTDANAAKPASIVAMSFGPNDPYPATDIRRFALAGGKAWMFEGTTDNRSMNIMRDTMNARAPGSARYTSYVGGHSGWENFYTPAYRENVGGTQMNIYEWQSLQTKSSNIGPSANAGADQNITTATSITLSGSGTDADGTIASYAWTRISGPNTPTITSPASASTSVTGLVTGTYVFRLTVTDNEGATGTDDVTINKVSTNVLPTVSAAAYKTVYLPTNSTTISATASDADGTISSYSWSKLIGGTATMTNSSTSTLGLSNLQEGEYLFRIVVTDNGGGQRSDTTGILVTPTAQTQIRSVSDTHNLNGSNPGYYGNQWRDTGLYRIAYNAGVRSTRSTVPMHFFTTVSPNGGRLPEFQFLYDLGFRENTVFLNNQTSTEYPDRGVDSFSGKRTKLPRGLYQPIWRKDGSVDTSNRFAVYMYNMATYYGDYVKYYEIWNEPDFTYTANGDKIPGQSGNWWDAYPATNDLENLNAPIQHYIRMLRIAWEVLHKYDDDAVVTTGGLGYSSFVNALLRSTDNPVDGTVSTDYPYKAGAYFDVFSWHIYPHYYPNYYNAQTNQTNLRRHTDELLNQTYYRFGLLEKELTDSGYNDALYPRKPSILTEVNIPRRVIGSEFGSNDAQRNGAWKFLVFAAKKNVSQTYWFETGDERAENNAVNVFNVMGLYYNLGSGGATYGNEVKTDLGIATTTWTAQMSGYYYDSVRTKAMQMPGGVDGAAYKNAGGQYKYVIWARTVTDSSEFREFTYNFPAALAGKTMTRVAYNGATSTIQPLGVALTGEPVILIPTANNSSANFVAGNAPVITLPGQSFAGPGNDYLTVAATITSPDGRPMKYYWEQIPSYGTGSNTFNKPAIKYQDSTAMLVSGFPNGRYTIRITATDDRGLYSSKDLVIRKNVTEQTVPVVTARGDTTIAGNAVSLTGSATTSVGSPVYQWVQISGAPVVLNNVNTNSASAVIPQNGVYKFRMYATDANGSRSEDDVIVTRAAAEPTTPVIRVKKRRIYLWR